MGGEVVGGDVEGGDFDSPEVSGGAVVGGGGVVVVDSGVEVVVVDVARESATSLMTSPMIASSSAMAVMSKTTGI